MLGFSTATGVWLLLHEEDTISNFVSLNHHRHWIYYWPHIAWRPASYTLESFIINERHDHPIPQQIASQGTFTERQRGGEEVLQIGGSELDLLESKNILALYHVTSWSIVFLVALRGWTGLVLE